MCMICVDYQKQLLTYNEAQRNLREMTLDPEHRIEVLLMLEEGRIAELTAKGLLPEPRYTFKVDVSGVPTEKAEAFLREVKKRMRPGK